MDRSWDHGRKKERGSREKERERGKRNRNCKTKRKIGGKSERRSDNILVKIQNLKTNSNFDKIL